MRGFVDMHQHVVYGLDDGAASFAASVDMLRISTRDAVREIIATPHVEPGRRRFEHQTFLHRLSQLGDACRENGWPLLLHPGAEILYTEATLRLLQEERVPTLAGSRFVLVEFQTAIAYEKLYEAVRTLANAGYVPVLAHVERYECLARDAERAFELKDLFRARLQVNCATVTGRRGLRLRRFLRALLSQGLVDYVATDAHNTTARPPCMRGCYDALCREVGAAYAARLTGGNQEEIFAGR